MFVNAISTIRLGLVGLAATLAAVVGVASSASAIETFQTGYGAVQLVSMLEPSAPQCASSEKDAIITEAYAPQYPPIAIEMGLEGLSLVNFTMALDGTSSDVKLAGTSGNKLFDRAALDAVRNSRFAPATHNCSKMAGVYNVAVVFARGSASTWPAGFTSSGGGGLRYPK